MRQKTAKSATFGHSGLYTLLLPFSSAASKQFDISQSNLPQIKDWPPRWGILLITGQHMKRSDRQTERQADRCYQTYYLPASLLINTSRFDIRTDLFQQISERKAAIFYRFPAFMSIGSLVTVPTLFKGCDQKLHTDTLFTGNELKAGDLLQRLFKVVLSSGHFISYLMRGSRVQARFFVHIWWGNAESDARQSSICNNNPLWC